VGHRSGRYRRPPISLDTVVRHTGGYAYDVTGLGFVHHSRASFCCAVPNLSVTIRNLFRRFQVGPSPSLWEGLLKRSSDSGVTWSAAERMPAGVAGPAKNKVLLLRDGASPAAPRCTRAA
jgi:hypothetical protein